MRWNAVAILVLLPAAATAADVFLSEPTAIRNGWSTFPVLTGRTPVPLLGGTAGQLFPWAPNDILWDGLGATRIDDDTIQVYINFEMLPGGVGRVHLDRDGLRTWIEGRVVGNTNFNQVPAPAGLVEGMGRGWNRIASGPSFLQRPCSGNLWEPHTFGYDRGFGDTLFLFGEEALGPHGNFWAIDTATDTAYAATDVGGLGSWESATLIDTGRTDTIALLLGEDLGSDPAGTAKLSLYVGRKNPAGGFLERNGLAGGTTYFWDADGPDNLVGTLSGTLFTGNAAAVAGRWTTDPTEAVLFSKAEDVHADMQPTSAGFGTRAVLASQGEGVFLVDFSTLDFVAGDLGPDRRSEVSVLFAAGTDLGDGRGQPGLFAGMDNLTWSADGSVYVNEDDGEGDVWQIRVAELLADYAAGDLTPDADTVFQILDADPMDTLDIGESSGIIDISALVGYVPGSVFLSSGMGSIADQLVMLVSPAAAAIPATTSVTVPTGSTAQRQAGFPLLAGSTPVVKSGAGTLVLDQINTLTGSFTVQAGRVELAHPRALEAATLAVLAGGTAGVASGLAVTVGSAALQAGGLLDVGTGLVTVRGGLTATELVAAIRAGRSGGAWTGTAGVTSTLAAGAGAAASRAVGWRDDGAGSLTFGYAAAGDTNLDWAVDVLDIANLIASGRYNSAAAATWQTGDFTYDGWFDVLDVAAFVGNGLYGAGPYQAAAAAAAVAAVPEPGVTPTAVVGMVAIMAAAAGRRGITGGRISGRPSGRSRPIGSGRPQASRGRPSRGPRAPAPR